jgi:DNA-binding MarR family transcriptional regulator
MAEHDSIDVIMGQWRRERPDLDLSAMGTFARLMQLSAVLGPAVERVFARHGLRRGEFDVLAALRRSGPPYAVIPSELADAMMMSRAGMTNRIDRLEAAGLVKRSLDPTDRRSFQIALTDAGHRLVDAAVTDHAANITQLISGLSRAERQTLDRILRSLLRTINETRSAAG